MPTQEQSPGVSPEPAPHCALHPEREALETCGRCGNYLCAICISSHAGKIVCVTCADRAGAAQPSRRAATSAVLSLLALVLGAAGAVTAQPLACLSLPLGLLGLGFAVVELNAIRAGASSSKGTRGAQLGLSLGVLAVVAPLIALLFTRR